MPGAVVYTRISDEEQGRRNAANIPTQTKKARDHCDRLSLPVLKVFIDEESARTVERLNLQKLLDYCREHRGKVSHVVVADLSRLARNVADQGMLIGRLAGMGAQLLSVDEPHIDRTAAGKLSANLLGSVNQFYSDILSERVRYRMPKKGRGKSGALDPLSLPVERQTALEALYGHYAKTFELWEERRIKVPPCFIVVCNNTSASKLVYDFISGFHRENEDGSTILENGRLELFRNFDDYGNQLARPRTLLIDSEQLESGEGLDDKFRAMAADEIDRFRREIVERTGDRQQAENISDQDLLREVMNTAGKEGRLGEPIRCVVSVPMLTEGWDANTVTHVLGVRAFGTQLLCEQVIGRALRRQSYDLNEEGPDKGLRTTFGTLMAAAEMAELIPSNPVRKTRFPRRGAVRQRAVIAPEKIQALLAALPEPSRSIAWLLVLTGLRIGELLAVRWRNVHLEHGTLRVTESVYSGHFDVPKTERSQRTVPLSANAIQILAARKPAVVNPEALVFATRDGSPFDRHNLSRRQLNSTCKKIGLVGVGWYWLRHANATLLDAVGTPLGTVQALLGHSSPEITREVYLHSIPSDARAAVEKVDELLNRRKLTEVPENWGRGSSLIQ